MMDADPQILPTHVFVYRNLHKTGPNGEPVYSVRDVATGLVVMHTCRITLAAVRFTVSAAGRARVLAERQKNVHAGVRGTPTAAVPMAGMRRARYNPYETETFVDRKTGKPLPSARTVVLDSSGVHYRP